MGSRSGIGQVATAVLIFIVLASGLIGYEYGVSSSGQRTQISVTTESPASNGTTVTLISLKTTTEISNSTRFATATENGGYVTNITQTFFQTNTVSENNSLSDLVYSNITLPGFADYSALNTKTDLLYVSYSPSNYSGLAVISGSTDTLITTIPSNYSGGGTPVVDPDTNTIYFGNEIINGDTNQISSYYNSSLTFIAADPKQDVVYAMNTTWNGYNGNTTIYQINGKTNLIESSTTFTGDPEAGDNPITINPETGVLYFAVCTTYCGFVEEYIIGVAPTPSGLRVVAQIPINLLTYNLAPDTATNMLYVTASQNLLVAINCTTNQITAEIPFTAYANQLRGIDVDPFTNEIFLSGSPDCNGFSGCGVTTLYVVSGQNLGIFATFESSNLSLFEFDPVNNQTYALPFAADFITALKIPQYNITILLP